MGKIKIMKIEATVESDELYYNEDDGNEEEIKKQVINNLDNKLRGIHGRWGIKNSKIIPIE